MAEEKKPAEKKPAEKKPAAKKATESKAAASKAAPKSASKDAAPKAAAAPKKETAAKAAAPKSESKAAPKKDAAAKPAAKTSTAKAPAAKAAEKAAPKAAAKSATTTESKAPAKKAAPKAKPDSDARPQVLKMHHLRPAPGAKTAKTRVGRGEASKGKTAGRGTKGTRARNTVRIGLEGGNLNSIMRAPKLRGFTNPFRTEYQVVNLDRLAELYPKGGDVTRSEEHTSELQSRPHLVCR